MADAISCSLCYPEDRCVQLQLCLSLMARGWVVHSRGASCAQVSSPHTRSPLCHVPCLRFPSRCSRTSLCCPARHRCISSTCPVLPGVMAGGCCRLCEAVAAPHEGKQKSSSSDTDTWSTRGIAVVAQPGKGELQAGDGEFRQSRCAEPRC